MKIPSGGQLQFELPGEDPDNPDYTKYLEGVIVYSHNANAYWPDGEDYDDNILIPPHHCSPPVLLSLAAEVPPRRRSSSFLPLPAPLR